METLLELAGESFSWQTLGMILALVALEAVLSADNAVALAALAQNIAEPKQQRQALNLGMIAAFGLRLTLLLVASWVVQFWQFELIGAVYLLWLSGKYFWAKFLSDPLDMQDRVTQPNSFWQVIILIAITDLAFSIDSVTAAVALSDQVWIVVTGCAIGVVVLRFLAELFIRWLSEFTYLQDAAYLTVVGVGLRLLAKATLPDSLPPDWTVLLIVAIVFTWGFSKREGISTPEPCLLPVLPSNCATKGAGK